MVKSDRRQQPQAARASRNPPRRGGRAIQLTRAAEGGTSLVARHLSSLDRTGFQSVLDMSISCGQCRARFRLHRADARSGVTVEVHHDAPAFARAQGKGTIFSLAHVASRQIGLVVQPQDNGRVCYFAIRPGTSPGHLSCHDNVMICESP